MYTKRNIYKENNAKKMGHSLYYYRCGIIDSIKYFIYLFWYEYFVLFKIWLKSIQQNVSL